MLQASGAPFDQGVAQGRALGRAIVRTRDSLRRRYGPLGFRSALRRARDASGLPMQRFLPQLHERLRGIAAGACIGPGALELEESLQRVHGVASLVGTQLVGRLEIPCEIEPALSLRHSAPDAVGFASAELTAAAWPGCLAGLNEEGLAVVVIEDRGARSPSLRSFAQDLILRCADVASAADHLRLRGRYAGGDGALLALDADGCARRFELAGGDLRVAAVPGSDAAGADATVQIDAAARLLIWGEHRFELASGSDGASPAGGG